MSQLWRRIVAAGLLTGGFVGCATLPDSIAGRHGAATNSIMPAVHWNAYGDSGRIQPANPRVQQIPAFPRFSSNEESTELLSAEVAL